MPRLSTDMESANVHTPAGTFAYSRTKLDALGASEYTLSALITDSSGSVFGYARGMEECLKRVIKAMRLSPRADNLLLRKTIFNEKVKEIHGFKELSNIKDTDYDNFLRPNGGTALYDGTLEGVAVLAREGEHLYNQDYIVNGFVVVITDGEENASKVKNVVSVREAFEECLKREKLESLLSILIGVNCPPGGALSNALQQFKDDAGFSQFVALADAKESTLAHLAGFISASLASQSSKVGSGCPSQPINPASLVI